MSTCWYSLLHSSASQTRRSHLSIKPTFPHNNNITINVSITNTNDNNKHRTPTTTNQPVCRKLRTHPLGTTTFIFVGMYTIHRLPRMQCTKRVFICITSSYIRSSVTLLVFRWSVVFSRRCEDTQLQIRSHRGIKKSDLPQIIVL